MEKSIRLLILFAIPALLLIFISVVWAAPPSIPLPPDQQPIGPDSQLEPTPVPIEALNTEQLDNLPVESSSGSKTSPMNATVYFTAPLPAGIYEYTWIFGDGDIVKTKNTQVSHVFKSKGAFVVTVIASVDGVPKAVGSVTVFVDVPVKQTYIPAINYNYDPVPDLRCAIKADPPNPSADDTILLSVDIFNASGTADGFWVDLYIDPKNGKPNGNTRWGTVCDPATCPGGIAWGISDDPLYGGITRTLRSVPNNNDPDGFDPLQTIWQGNQTLSQPRTYQLYAYVDSWDPDNSYGAVEETNEANNVCSLLLTVKDAKPVSNLKSKENLLPDRSGP